MSASITGIPREPRLQALRYWVADHKLPVFGWGAILALIVGALLAWQVGVVDPSPLAEPETSFGTEGANLVEKGGIGDDVEVGAVGDGQTRTYIIREKGATGPQPAVIFLHGFGSSIIAGYEPWLEHLAKSGVTVIFPSWQQPPFPTDGSQNPRTNMFRGVELAVKAVPVIPSQVAAVGVSAGAALAFDYAALGKKLDIPKANLVLSIYPGRAFPGQKEAILPIPPVGDMEPDALVVTMVSPRDKVAGTSWGKQQYKALATRPDDLRQLVYVKTPGLGNHFSPGKTDAKARAQYWKRLDNLMTTHLGAKLTLDSDLRESIRADRRVQKDLAEASMFRKKAESGE